MKLYFAPGTCALAPHIISLEGPVALEYERVSLRTKTTETGKNYLEVNPRGYVPALALDDGTVLTEANVIVQFLAERAAGAALLPPQGSIDRYRALEWLSYVATELHKSFSLLFNPKASDDFKELVRTQLGDKFTMLSSKLEGNEGLMGAFSAPDAYLFTVLRWTQFVGIDRSKWPALQAWYERTAQRPSVKSALEAQGVKP